jgi:hypothetical protein
MVGIDVALRGRPSTASAGLYLRDDQPKYRNRTLAKKAP